jgi:hypothetical protein
LRAEQDAVTLSAEQPLPAHAPSTWYRSFHHLQQLLDAYAGQEPDDEPGKPGHALSGYLRTITLSDPAGPVIAAAQARDLIAKGVLDSDTFVALELLPRPTGLSEQDYFVWLATVAELCEQAADAGYPPSSDLPPTAWEWRQNYPVLHQLLAGYVGQDLDAEVPAAINAWATTADTVTLVRALGECNRLIASCHDRITLDSALTALGCDAERPEPPDPWLRRLNSHLWSLCIRRSGER